MPFHENLSALMDICRVGNIALARGIGVDPSLVSRWKSGERVPASGSPVIRKIAAFLAGVPLREHDRDVLRRAVGGEPGAHALAAFLREEEEGLPVQRLALCLSAGDSPPRTPVNLWPRVQKGQPWEHQIFYGPDGKRQAVINFLHEVLSSGRRGPVCLFSQEDPGWRTGDPSFAALWRQALLALLAQGHTVREILPDPADWMGHLEQNWPLYETGAYETLAAGSPSWGAATLFVSPGVAALDAFCHEGAPNAQQTVLYRSAADTVRYDMLFAAAQKNARPLFSARLPGQPAFETLMGWEASPGRAVVSAAAPGLLWLPEELADAILRQTCPSGGYGDAAEALRRAREPFWVMPREECWPESLLHTEELRLPGSMLPGGREAALSAAQSAAVWEHICALLRRQSNLTAGFLPAVPLSVYEKNGAGTLCAAGERAPLLMLGERTGTRGMHKPEPALPLIERHLTRLRERNSG